MAETFEQLEEWFVRVIAVGGPGSQSCVEEVIQDVVRSDGPPCCFRRASQSVARRCFATRHAYWLLRRGATVALTSAQVERHGLSL
jgi:hypothetical protein